MATSPPASQQDLQRLIGQLNNGQLAQAESTAKSLIAKHANTFILHHVLALALDGQSKFAESVASYRNALKLEPNHADLHFNLGIALTNINWPNLNQQANAEASFREAIRLNPRFFEAHGSLGACLQRQGKLDAAISSYQTGLTINPQDARGHFNLGTVLRDKGALDDAVKNYQSAIQYFPNYTDAYNNLGETLRDQGNMEAAVKSYQAALALNVEHANANYNMADFLVLAKKYDEAIAYFERSQLEDWQARVLYCLYKAEKFEAFAQKRDELMAYEKQLTAGLLEEKKIVNKRLYDSLMSYLKEYNKDGKFKYIFNYSQGGVFFMADDKLDITGEVVKGMNERYEKNKPAATK